MNGFAPHTTRYFSKMSIVQTIQRKSLMPSRFDSVEHYLGREQRLSNKKLNGHRSHCSVLCNGAERLPSWPTENPAMRAWHAPRCHASRTDTVLATKGTVTLSGWFAQSNIFAILIFPSAAPSLNKYYIIIVILMAITAPPGRHISCNVFR